MNRKLMTIFVVLIFLCPLQARADFSLFLQAIHYGIYAARFATGSGGEKGVKESDKATVQKGIDDFENAVRKALQDKKKSEYHVHAIKEAREFIQFDGKFMAATFNATVQKIGSPEIKQSVISLLCKDSGTSVPDFTGMYLIFDDNAEYEQYRPKLAEAFNQFFKTDIKSNKLASIAAPSN